MSRFCLRSRILLTLCAALILLVRPAIAQGQASLTFDIVDRAGWSGDRSASLPASVTETYRYDVPADTLSVTCRFDRQGLAPLPPMLALAKSMGFPVDLDRAVEKTAVVSALGPLMGCPDTQGYTYRIRGLSRYVLAPAHPGAGRVPPSLQRELENGIARVIEAGHMRPWLCLVNVPGSGADSRGDVYWDNPGETLYLLAETAPLLSPAMRQRLRAYLKRERNAFPPEMLATAPYTEGTPREYSPQETRLMRDWQEKVLAFRTKAEPGVWNLYGLARYYELTGEKPTAQVMSRCSEIVARQMEHRDWATLYWRRGYTPSFNAVDGANRLFAGFSGYIRLARMAHDARAETLGWGMLGRMAVLRYAMGKYTQFLYDTHQFNPGYRILPNGGEVRPGSFHIQVETDPARYTILNDPAWWVKAHAGNWIGELVTWSWTRPIDNVRQVERLDETGVDVWEWGGVDCGGNGQKRDAGNEYWYERMAPYLLPFRDLTPEVGRFLADYLKPETEAFCRRVDENLPHEYAAYSEAILGAEDGFNSPWDACGLFLARAWVLDERPQVLERIIDVPWLKVGDLYYLHKLEVTLAAYRDRSE